MKVAHPYMIVENVPVGGVFEFFGDVYMMVTNRSGGDKCKCIMLENACETEIHGHSRCTYFPDAKVVLVP